MTLSGGRKGLGGVEALPWIAQRTSFSNGLIEQFPFSVSSSFDLAHSFYIPRLHFEKEATNLTGIVTYRRLPECWAFTWDELHHLQELPVWRLELRARAPQAWLPKLSSLHYLYCLELPGDGDITGHTTLLFYKILNFGYPLYSKLP
jgi:hypothetical protein